ncbi:efflux RND transporter permease subunit [Marinivivus vitaminiproducens]|uniref:efflux RND transporter permease subunit n=1 Tax=Marinivivus vitaminiproducens TaxID=3035935 RepID=UPI0027A16C57|nr:MMPL family transporter [Geminicoccaceae bacterium SCSIO 64248]
MFERLNPLAMRLATLVFRHPIVSTILFALLVAAAVSGLPRLQPDGRIEAFMREDDPALRAYQQMRETFGQDNRIVVSVGGGDVFDLAFVEKLARLHETIGADVPYIAELFSPYNIPFIDYRDGGLYIEDLVRNMLARGEDPATMRERILETPLYRNFIVSADGSLASIVIEPNRFAPHPSDCVARPAEGISCPPLPDEPIERDLLGSDHYAEMTAAVERIVAEFGNDSDFVIHVSGAPVVSTEIVRLMSTDMPRFTLMSVGIALVVIMVMFRSPLVALAMLATFLTTIFSTFGLMAASGNPLTPPTQLLVPLLLVGSLCSFIHFMMGFLRGYAETRDKEAAIERAIAHAHAPIVFGALTTAAGLLGFLASDLAPVATLGLFGAIGSLIAYVCAFFMTLLVFRLLGTRFFERRSAEYPRLVALFTWLSLAAVAHRFKALAVVALLIGLSAIGISRLEYSHNSLLWLPEDNTVRRSTEFIDTHLRGTVNLEVVVTPEAGRDFRDEELLTRLDEAAGELDGLTDVPIGRHTSIIDFVKETNRALNEGDPAERFVPRQDAIYDQFLMLESEGTDDTQRYVSSAYDLGRLTVLTPWLEATRYTDFINRVQAHLGEALAGLATVQTTGLIALLSVTSTAVLSSMISSYALATVQIFALMCVSLGRIGLGLLSMVPNILPFVFLLGIMGALGLPIDTFTVLVGAILEGLIVDDTTHYFFHYKRNFDRLRDPKAAIRATIAEVGEPMSTTTLVVMASFAVFAVSSLTNLITFALLMVLGAVLALLCELFVSPVVLSFLKPARRRQEADAASPVPALESGYAS